MSRKSRGISEHEPWRRLIDSKLQHAGWGSITVFDENQKYTNETVIEYKTSKGPGDYVLFHNGKSLAL